MCQYIFYTLQWHLRCQSKCRLHLSPTLIHLNKFVSLNSMQNKVHELTFFILSSIRYIYIPAFNITTQLLVFYCDTTLVPDFLTKSSKDAWTTTHLSNECLFLWVHGVWIVARDKQIVWTVKRFSGDLFVPRYDSYPMNPEKRHSFLIFTMFPTRTLSKILWEKLFIQNSHSNGHLTSFDVHFVLITAHVIRPNRRTFCDSIHRELNWKILAGFNEGNMIPL